MAHLYLLQTIKVYNPQGGFFIIDDTMKHHSKFCQWIHGVFTLFDHALNTNLKATCIVFLYYSDGGIIKFPINFRIFYKENSEMPWQKGDLYLHSKKYNLAVEMIEKAIGSGFPKCTVLADSWYGIGPFINELKRLELSYILEVKASYNVKTVCKEPKRTPKGKVAKNQFDLIGLPEFFKSITSVIRCGLAANMETGKKEKVLYHAKVATIRLNSIPDKHRVVESYDPVKKTTKYLLTNQLTWEATKILTFFNCRWAVEEFFRNAKQLTDMEGVTIRSEQGVTLALSLVSWIDFLLHFENYKRCIAGELPKEPLTIPSIIRRLQHENTEAFIKKIQSDEIFVKNWLKVLTKEMERTRKKRKELMELEGSEMQLN
jgi:hypothetical protein